MSSSYSRIKVGVINEGKVPPDSRVPITPRQAQELSVNPELEVVFQSSSGRCFADDEYRSAGATIVDNVEDCDFLIGVKEVPIKQLIPNKNYIFFSHTHKKQVYNRPLLQAVIDKKVRLIDYELLTNEKGKRVIAFGKYAGMVGAHHALRAWGIRSGKYDFAQMRDIPRYANAVDIYKKTNFGKAKFVVTGRGRVGKGAALVLKDAGLKEVSNQDFLNQEFEEAVYTCLDVPGYVDRKDGEQWERRDFYKDPLPFKSIFYPYAQVADVMIHGIFWDNRSPAMFTLDEMAQDDFKIQVIADVTCDIAPLSSMPCTIKASTIADPYFGFNPQTREECDAFDTTGITMMTVDNLPNEMPHDASTGFGEMFLEYIIPEMIKDQSDVLDRATIAKNGQLTDRFKYLEDFLNEA